jgi:hypothetical protein
VWDCRPGEADATDRAQLAVFRFDERQYYAEWREDTKVDRYRAYPAKLGGVPVVSIQDLGDGSSGKPWTVLRSSLESDGSLAIQSPARRILDMNDEAAALRELRSKASAPATWQPFARCVRHQD